MSLDPGVRLGPYEIVSSLGAGGMGEVYRARDTKLGRDVALKILPDAFANDNERLARFRREAQVLASLNHQNIAAIYGLEDSGDSAHALVMELVDGPTLADRIAQAPIPIDDALPIARQIAEALDAAHELGIIHRDLKPANIKLRPDGTVKVLDFGLAKILDPAAGDKTAATDATYSPTISLASTRAGMILGTAAYMAPEQARGRVVDKRADVWAFGVVLYEMLTGRAAFAGDDVSDILASVLKFEPDWTSLPAETPASIRRLLKRCLTKDPKLRLRECGSALADIHEALNGPDASQPLAPAAHRDRRRLMLPAVAAVALAAMAGVTAWALIGNRAAATPQPTRRFTITLPEGEILQIGSGQLLALSRDGRTLVYRARTGTVPARLFRRSIDQFEAVAIPGTEDNSSFAFSPDGSWLAFAAGGTLKRMALSGGPAQTIATIGPSSGSLGRVDWNTADQVVFGRNAGGGLMQVPANGGEPAQLFKPEGQLVSRFPQSLPGTNAVLFTLGDVAREAWELHVVKRDTGEHRTVLRTAGAGRVLPTGHLVFVRADALWAMLFDRERLEAVGSPVPVVEGVRVEPGGAVQYDVSDEGTLVYIQESAAAKEKSLLFVGTDRRAEPLSLPKRDYIALQLSPDQSRVAVQIGQNDDADVWVGEVERGALTRVTREAGFDGSAIWSLDGKTVVFASSREGRWTLHQTAADGTGEAATLATFDKVRSVAPRSWSADGKMLVVEVDDDIGVVEVGGKSDWKPLIQTPRGAPQPAVSPDGRWIVYTSTDVGREGTVYLQRFPGLGDRRPVSLAGGGYLPAWSRDGRALFYLRGSPTNELMRVSVKAGPDGRLDIGTPEVFTEWNYSSFGGSRRCYDVSLDGRRVLVISRGENEGTSKREQIHVVLNWFEELKRLVPVK